MSSYFSTTHLFSVSYEFVLSLVEKSPFMLLKCLFKGCLNAHSKALNAHSKPLNGHSKALNGHPKAMNRTFICGLMILVAHSKCY